VEEGLDKILRSWAGQLWAGLLDGAGAHPEAAAALDVDSGWMLDEWERELFERLLWQSRGGSVRFVESSVGGGRSHFLHLLAARARRAGMATIVIPAEQQSEILLDPLVLYRQVSETLIPSRSPGQTGFPGLVLATRCQDAARAELFPEFPNWGLALQLWAQHQDPQAQRFLLGQSLDEGASCLGLHAPLTSRQALLALRCLLCYLDFCGEKGLVALCDGDGALAEDQERATLEALRNLIDSCAGGLLPGLLLVLAVLPHFRTQVLPDYEALRQRLHHGLSVGPAGCLRPILVLEEQRKWRASQGVDFTEQLFLRVRSMAVQARPELAEAPAILRRNADAMLDELPWDPATAGAVRGLTRTMARWFADPNLPLDSSDPELHQQRVAEFLDQEAV
jgi:hypothetical protein